MKEELITKAYEVAKERYAALGIDVEKVYLEYDVDFGFKQIATKDTLVLQTRGTNKLEVFAPKYKAN